MSRVRGSLSGSLKTIRRIVSKPAALIGLIIVLLFYAWSLIEGIMQFLAGALHYPSIAWALLPDNPFQPNLGGTLLPPNLTHWMGTDELGRDLWSRVLYAAPADAAISLLVIAGAVTIGGALGLTAGYFGRGVEEVNMRVTDLFLAFPALILALVIETTLGRSVNYAILALITVWWPSYARIFRAEMLRIKSKKFIDSALLSGLSGLAIIRRHAIRASLNTVVSYATIDLGNVILTYSILSFLGLGITPPAPEWGTLVSQGLQVFPQQWWYSILPGAVITVIVIGSSLLGDGIRDLLAGELRET